MHLFSKERTGLTASKRILWAPNLPTIH